MSEQTKCPACGAEVEIAYQDGRLHGFKFVCGTRMNPAKKADRKIDRQSDTCKLRQHAALLTRCAERLRHLGGDQTLAEEIEALVNRETRI